MPDRLEIIVTLKDVASKAFTKISSTARRFGASVVDGAKRAGRGLLDLAKNIFFVGAAFDMVSRAAGKVFNLFIRGAGDAKKLEAKLKNIVGSSEDAARVMDFLSAVAQQTGADFDELASGAGLMAVAAKDASGAFDFNQFKRLSNMLQRMAALRPDVPLDRLARGLSVAVTTGNWSSLEMFLDVNLRQLLGLADAADDVADIPGEIGGAATFIQTKTGEAAKDALKSIDLLDEALRKAGATAGIVADVAELSGMERFSETLESIARTLGEPLFEAINEGAAELAQWLQDNPEEIERFATALGKLGAVGIEKVFGAITKLIAETDWDAFFDKAIEFVDKLASGDIEGAFAAIGAGDLGESLTATADALATIAEILISVAQALGADTGTKRAIGAAGKAASIVAPGGAGYEEIGKAFGVDNLGAILKSLIKEPGMTLGAIGKGLGVGGPQQVEVTIKLDNDLLDAQITQTSEGIVTGAFDELGQRMGER